MPTAADAAMPTPTMASRETKVLATMAASATSPNTPMLQDFTVCPTSIRCAFYGLPTILP
ncbi:hypothetical protein GCM10010052_05500 [Paenarthrobacter histidinolovorans]|nr:hypothetical protein GCM10010052_05500 [Paenarthrobacter histidinolovorans]